MLHTEYKYLLAKVDFDNAEKESSNIVLSHIIPPDFRLKCISQHIKILIPRVVYGGNVKRNWLTLKCVLRTMFERLRF